MSEALGALRRFTDAESTHPVTPTDIEAITDMAALAHSRSEPGARSGGWIASPWRRIGRAAALLLAAVGLASLFTASVSVEDGRLTKGKLVVISVFGTGFTWGSALIRWSY